MQIAGMNFQTHSSTAA
ncbi:DUF6783 domain-containing protein [Eisenbergiella tayi]